MPVSAGHTYYIVIDGYGSQRCLLRWTSPTPVRPRRPGACCCLERRLHGHDQSTRCAGVWQGEDTVCIPNPCPPPPPVACPAGALIEGEPPCVHGNPVDDYNGGCNSTPVVFQPLNPQAGGCAIMCGKSCAWARQRRDTDWFVSIGTGALMTGTATAEFPLQYLLIYARERTLAPRSPTHDLVDRRGGVRRPPLRARAAVRA